MKLKATCAHCGKPVDISLKVTWQKKYKLRDNSFLQTGMIMLTDMTCPNCGEGLGYISHDNEDEEEYGNV